MDVGIDESGHKRDVAEIKKFGVLRMFYGGTEFGDAIILDEDFTRSDEFAGFDLEKAGGVKNDGVFGRRRR